MAASLCLPALQVCAAPPAVWPAAISAGSATTQFGAAAPQANSTGLLSQAQLALRNNDFQTAQRLIAMAERNGERPAPGAPTAAQLRQQLSRAMSFGGPPAGTPGGQDFQAGNNARPDFNAGGYSRPGTPAASYPTPPPAPSNGRPLDNGGSFAPSRFPSAAGASPQSLSPQMRAARDQVLRLTTQAQMEMDKGNYPAADRLVNQALGMGVPEEAFEPQMPNPGLLQLEIRRGLQRGNVAPAGFNNNPAQPQYPVNPGVYRPQNDNTRVRPASDAQLNPASPPARRFPATGPAAETAYQVYQKGMEAMQARDRETALKHFTEAWNRRKELDPRTQQVVQEQLTVLQTAAAVNRRDVPAADSPLTEVANQQTLLRQQLMREITRERAEAERMRKDDPRGALARLNALQKKLAEAKLDPAVKKSLTSGVDRAAREMEKYIELNLAKIETQERNDAVNRVIENERQTKYETQNELARLVNQFNQLMDEERYSEAIVLSKQARELAPNDEVVQTMIWKAKFAHRIITQSQIRERYEEGFNAALTSVDEASVPFDDREPYIFGDAREWQELTTRRRATLERQASRYSKNELAIRAALKKEVDARFINRPLAEVMSELAKIAAVNIFLDPQGMTAEGVTSATPVTLNLTQPVSLKSALNLILQPLHLGYVIQNEVLRITSEQARESDVYNEVYNVADLVIPIPNFVPSYNMGLPGAIAAAHNAIGHGGHAATGGTVPLTLASSTNGNTDGSVLAQMQSSGLVPNGGRGQQTVGAGPGGLGGGSQADFDSLIDLITTTIAPESWDDVGGPGSVSGFETNLSLVVSQTQEVHDQIADLLKQLRRLQDLQVTIEVRFITVSDNFFERIGVDFDFQIEDQTGLTPAQASALAFGPNDGGPTATVGLDVLGVPTADLDLQFSQGGFASTIPQFGGFDAGTAANFGFAILSDIEAYFLVQAAQGDTRSNQMQAPKVTLFNGQQAFISETAQRPFVTSVIPVVGDFAAAHQPVVVVLSEGTSLSVQAVVSNDRRFVRLTLVPFFSSIGEVQEFTFDGKTTTSGGTPVADPVTGQIVLQDGATTSTEGTTVQLPTFNFTTVTTTVSVPDGGTVLMGGIKSLNEGRTERGVPMLSKIPYVNRLFKNVGIGRETRSLMMMVTPRIIIQEEEEERAVGRPLTN